MCDKKQFYWKIILRAARDDVDDDRHLTLNRNLKRIIIAHCPLT